MAPAACIHAVLVFSLPVTPHLSLALPLQLASNAQLYVNDAFGTAHRAHASTEGVTKFLKPSVAGFLLQKVQEAAAGLQQDQSMSSSHQWIYRQTAPVFRTRVHLHRLVSPA